MSKRNQLIVVVLLAIAFIGIVAFQFSRKPPAPPPSEKPVAKTTAPAATRSGGSPTNPAPAAARGAAPTAIKKTDVDIGSLLAGIKEVNFNYEEERQARDPMMPLVGKVNNVMQDGEAATAAAPATVGQVINESVSGIAWDPKTPVAVVDNDLVYPGFEYADGTAVVAVERDRVVFKVGDTTVEVKLKEL